MSEVYEGALISREGQPASANSTVAKQSGRVATKLDSLLVLAAVLAYTFGWGPMLEVPGVGAVIIIAAALLWLLFERVVPLKGRWVASDGWLRTLTKGDVLILLLALLNSPFLHIPLLVAVVIWGFVSGLAWLRGQRAGADDWFHRAAIFASFVAIMIGEEASKVCLYSGAVGSSPYSGYSACSVPFEVLPYKHAKEAHHESNAGALPGSHRRTLPNRGNHHPGIPC